MLGWLLAHLRTWYVLHCDWLQLLQCNEILQNFRGIIMESIAKEFYSAFPTLKTLFFDHLKYILSFFVKTLINTPSFTSSPGSYSQWTVRCRSWISLSKCWLPIVIFYQDRFELLQLQYRTVRLNYWESKRDPKLIYIELGPILKLLSIENQFSSIT